MPDPAPETNPDSATQLLITGYTIIPSFLSEAQLSTLRAAAKALTSLARAGHWPHVRTVGKQFPPWPTPCPASPLPIWGVQHLLHPRLPLPPPLRAAFVELYFSPDLLALSKTLLAPPDSATTVSDADLVMELFNMLVRPDPDPDPDANASQPGSDPGSFSLRWHRDDIPWSATAEEEEVALSRPAWHAQWNLALYDDDSLVLVPGSHRRARTDAEQAAAPYAGGMPGQERVVLRAGDVAFYDNNILHRGVYDGARERMTLHGSVGHVLGSRARARNVLQHGVGEYVAECDFGCLGEREREVAEGMRERLVEMGRDNVDVGFSLHG